MEMIVQISAGQGPEECQIAVGKLYQSLKDEFKDLEIVSCKEGRSKGSYHSILFITEQDLSFLEGSVQWIWKSTEWIFKSRGNRKRNCERQQGKKHSSSINRI